MGEHASKMANGKYDHVKQLIHEGSRAEAQAELAAMVRADPQDADAWYGLAQVVDDPERKRYCLEKAHQLRPEAVPAPAPVQPAPAPPTAAAKPKNVNVAIGCLALFAMMVLCMGLASSGFLSGPGETPEPTERAVAGPSYFQIRSQKDTLTDVQWKAYEDSIRGRRVQWRGRISEIAEDILGDNYVWIDMDSPPDGMHDVYFPYPVDESMRYSKGQQVVFTGELDGSSDVLIFAVKLANARIGQ